MIKFILILIFTFLYRKKIKLQVIFIYFTLRNFDKIVIVTHTKKNITKKIE